MAKSAAKLNCYDKKFKIIMHSEKIRNRKYSWWNCRMDIDEQKIGIAVTSWMVISNLEV